MPDAHRSRIHRLNSLTPLLRPAPPTRYAIVGSNDKDFLAEVTEGTIDGIRIRARSRRNIESIMHPEGCVPGGRLLAPPRSWAAHLSDSRLYKGHALAKRVLDVAGACTLLLAFGWLIAAVALLVRIVDGTPVFYRQTRTGLRGRQFTIFKFRTMRPDAEPDGRPTWSVMKDPRATRLGGYLRRLGLDELPQIFNVLRGDMSLVGPRPERPYFVEMFEETMPLYALRHTVKGGITGWAQINGFRGDTSVETRLHYDLYYIKNWSLWLDVMILCMTPFVSLIRKYGNRRADDGAAASARTMRGRKP